VAAADHLRISSLTLGNCDDAAGAEAFVEKWRWREGGATPPATSEVKRRLSTAASSYETLEIPASEKKHRQSQVQSEESGPKV
jgi:hypothetical protein